MDSVKVEVPSQRLSAVVYYPSDPALHERIRAALHDSAQAYVQDFVQSVEPVTPDMPEGQQNYLGGGIDTFYAGPTLVSGRFVAVSEHVGDAHPSHAARCFMFDRRTGFPVYVGDLFAPDAPYLYVLSEQVRASLRTSFMLGGIGLEDEAWFLNATAPLNETFSCTSVSADGLHVFFEPYRLGSYAFGEHEAVVPWPNLRRIVRSDGPAAAFLKPTVR